MELWNYGTICILNKSMEIWNYGTMELWKYSNYRNYATMEL